MKGTVYAITNGCQENQIDTATMQEILKKNGWKTTEDISKASLLVANVCGLTNNMEDSSLSLIKTLQSHKHPSAKLAVCGCLTKINRKAIEKLYDGDTFGSDDMVGLCRFAGINNGSKDISANYLLTRRIEKLKSKKRRKIESNLFDPYAYARKMTSSYYRYLGNKTNRMLPNDYFIKTSTGCLNYCSYCAVKLSRGDVKSRPVESIVKEFKTGLQNGHTEFGLLGTDLGSYGRDIDINLATLLRALLKIKGDYKIKIRNINPRFFIEMLPELSECFASGKIDHISSAVQSGSNRILNRMNRGYRIEEYQEIINSVQSNFPSIHCRTQIMVGFPGEEESDFRQTLELLDSTFFDYIELYKYSPRKNTNAAEFEDQIPQDVIAHRYNQLHCKSLINMTKRRYLN